MAELKQNEFDEPSKSDEDLIEFVVDIFRQLFEHPSAFFRVMGVVCHRRNTLLVFLLKTALPGAAGLLHWRV